MTRDAIPPPHPISRRTVLGGLATKIAVCAMPVSAQRNAPDTKAIPSTGEQQPIVSLGRWIAFNVGDDSQLLDERAAVVAAFSTPVAG
jgi:hypothetical protein